MSSGYLKDPLAGTIQGWMIALSIFAKYNEKGVNARLETAAEHDILYLPSKPEPKSSRLEDGDYVNEWDEAVKADAEKLDGLGFHWDGSVDCWAKFT
jgi:hypothetical protein